MFQGCDTDSDGFLSYSELQGALKAMKLGLSSKDLFDVVRWTDADNDGYVLHHLVSFLYPFILVS